MAILLILFLATAVQAAQSVPFSDASFIAALGEAQLTVPGIPQASRAGDGDERGLQEKCAQVVGAVDSVSDINVLRACSDFYWHNGEFDNPPGSFNNIIKIGYRVLALDPTDTDTYGNTAWLLWSKWVTWTQNPQQMPDGESKKEESIRIFGDGLAYNRSNSAFYSEYADHMLVFIQDYAKAAGLYQRADEFAGEDRLRVKARLGVARSYRQLGQTESAIKWYKAVLGIDPQNPIALKALRELGEDAPK